MQKHGTLKDIQSMLRHASIQTTGDDYVQRIDESVRQAVNSRTSAVLGFHAFWHTEPRAEKSGSPMQNKLQFLRLDLHAQTVSDPLANSETKCVKLVRPRQGKQNRL
jgi:hypothetical protein